MKTQEELNTIRQEFADLSAKLQELTDDELNEVTGGDGFADWIRKIGENIKKIAPKILTVSGQYAPEEDQQLVGSYQKDRGSDKNAKVIFTTPVKKSDSGVNGPGK